MMDFISLSEAVDSMAKYSMSELEKTSSAEGTEWYSNAAYAEATRYSEAASALHMYLYNSATAHPKWLGVDEVTSQPLHSDGIATEGMAMLRHMAGWRARLTDEHLRYMDECEEAEAAGIDVSKIRPSHKVGSGKYTRQGMMRAGKIGFNRADLISFLTANNAVHTLSNPATADCAKPRPIQAVLVSVQKEETILDAIKQANHDPSALPKGRSGMPGVRNEIWKRLKNEPMFVSKKSFEKAWDRLRADGKIKDAF